MVLKCPKLEPENKEKNNSSNPKNKAEEKKRMFLNFQILSLHHFAFFFCNYSLCAACFYAIDQKQVRMFNPNFSAFKFLF